MTGNSSFCVVGVSRGSDFGHIPRFTCKVRITDAIVKNMQRHVFDLTGKRKHCRPQ
ncbi:THUMP domain-containing protein [Cupriavidus agavae]|uniref:THUMP domain-containing protein n=1 Tax=Cupriavidus agavae TaxID=1001822 RepID=UPI0038B25819